MANQKTIAFQLKVDGVDKVVKSIDELDGAIQGLEQSLKKAEFGSEQFKALEGQLIKARSAKEDLDKSLEGRGAEKRLQGIIGLAEGIGGAFAVASTASSLFGKESEQLAKVEQKAQQAIATVMGIRAIKEGLLNSALERRLIVEKAAAAGTVILNAVNKALNITLSLNPIGLIVTALGLLVIGIAMAIGPIKKFIAQFDFLNDALNSVLDTMRDIGSFLSGGLIDDAATSKTRANAEEVVKSLDDVGSAENRAMAQSKRRLELMKAQGATEKELLEQKKKINTEEVAARQKAVDALLKLQQIDGKLDDDKKAKLVELQEQIKDLNNAALIEQEEFNKSQQEKVRAAADKAKELRDKVLEQEATVRQKIKELQNQAYLDSIVNEQERAREALRIQQEAQQAEIQLGLDSLNKKKALTKEEVALKKALVEQQVALTTKQEQEVTALEQIQQKDRLQKEKEYNDQLLALQNELAAMSFRNAEDRQIRELELQLQQQVAEINQRQITEKQKSDLILAATQVTQLKVAELEQAQSQQVADFKFSLVEEGFAKSMQVVDLEKEAKLQQLQTLKMSEEEFADARVKIERQAAEAKDNIARAQLLSQLDATSQVLGSIGGLFKEGTMGFKAFKVAETGISTYSSAVKAYEATVGIPVIGPALAPIAAGAAVASGLMSIQKIISTQVPDAGTEDAVGTTLAPSKFAMGGLVTGIGGPTSDSVPALLSAGESVINANSTAMFGGLLSAINQSGGGVAIGDGQQAPVFKTYVVASDMSSQQEADKRVNDIARI